MNKLISKKRRISPQIPIGESNFMVLTDHPSHQDLVNDELMSDYTGSILQRMLRNVGMTKASCYITSVFKEQPDGQDIYSICANKKEVTKEAKEVFGWKNYPFTGIASGKYIRPFYCLSLFELAEEIRQVNPTIVVALGQVSLWALCGIPTIQKSRGVLTESTLVPGTFVIPTYHPRTINKKAEFKPIATIDLMKAKNYLADPNYNRIVRDLYFAETRSDLLTIENELRGCPIIGQDIETLRNKYISCLSFAPRPDLSFVIPFVKREGGINVRYWEDRDDEIEAWRVTKRILEWKDQVIVGQNYVYDLSYYFVYGIYPKNVRYDTMLAHHAQYPELPKSLGFLGSIYTNEIAWKDMRPKGKEAAGTKADD